MWALFVPFAAGAVCGAGATYLALLGRISSDVEAHQLSEDDPTGIADQFKGHSRAVCDQVSGYADLLASRDPQLRERLRLFEAGDQRWSRSA